MRRGTSDIATGGFAWHDVHFAPRTLATSHGSVPLPLPAGDPLLPDDPEDELLPPDPLPEEEPPPEALELADVVPLLDSPPPEEPPGSIAPLELGVPFGVQIPMVVGDDESPHAAAPMAEAKSGTAREANAVRSIIGASEGSSLSWIGEPPAACRVRPAPQTVRSSS